MGQRWGSYGAVMGPQWGSYGAAMGQRWGSTGDLPLGDGERDDEVEGPQPHIQPVHTQQRPLRRLRGGGGSVFGARDRWLIAWHANGAARQA